MKTNSLTLGLDLGVSSIGWGLIDFENQAIVEAGVLTHDAPMELAKYEAGRPGSSNAVKRRQSIHQGRQLARRKARHRDLYISLQERGLLPYAGKKAEQRHLQLTELDRKLSNGWLPRIKTEAPDIPDPGQVVLYYLRHIALTSKLSEFELGRALYHLGQRRGFKSNRRESGAKDAASENKSAETTSEIKFSIKTLQGELGTSGLTLGSYLSHVNPHITALRNRKRADIKPIWVGRAMFEEEFDRIWTAQSSYYPSILTPDFKRQVERLLFWQRKVSAGKPGRCALEENEIRAPRSSLLAQHFRLLQTLNNIKLRETSFSSQRRLARTERDLLISALSKAIHVAKGSKQKESYGLTFTELKKHLGL